jgi:ribosomal protein S18 acetylase RimI-like enzyme
VRSASLAAIRQQEVVGYCLVGEGSIRELAVERRYRRMGVARNLMSRALDLLRADTLPVTLQVDASNDTGALELYASFGFRNISELTVWEKDLQP